MTEIKDLKSKYIEGKSSADELTALEGWLAQHPEEKAGLFRDKDILDAYALLADNHNYPVGHEFNRLMEKIGMPAPVHSLTLAILKIAAVFLIAFILGWMVKSLLSKNPAQEKLTEIRSINVPPGQVSQIFLSDGSRIWINSGSKLDVPSLFSGKNRTVRLAGEAFFEVAKDPGHPFIVDVDGQKVEVVGTSFNIRAYKNSDIVQTTLNTGKIRLTTAKGFVMLSPGHQTELDRKTGQVKMRKVNTENFNSWKEGRYEFVNENLVEVFHMVERWYDVKLIYKEQEFKAMNFSGVIKRNKPVSYFLELLGHSIPIRYEIEADTIKIEKLNKKQ